MPMSARILRSFALLLGLCFATACHHDADVLTGDQGVDDDLGVEFNLDAFLYDNDGGFPDGFVKVPLADGGIIVTLPDGGTGICYITPCQGHLYACGNCLDDDGDGLIDSYDPDCLGPCQNNEAGFYGNIPGQNNAPCKSDCYWDQDTGSGNDDCHWSHDCDPFEKGGGAIPAATSPEISCSYNANAKVPGAHVPGGQKDCAYLASNQTTQCADYCGPLTPTGCDCFGCCEDPHRPGNFVFAGSVNAAGTPTCTADPATLADPTKCKSCTPVLAASKCYKPCGTCQLCFGKTTLPPGCYASQPDMAGTPPSADLAGTPPPPPPQTCDPGVQACGLPGQSVCPPGNYCISGCCTVVVL